jgi:superfamily II DNA or RNA helicase
MTLPIRTGRTWRRWQLEATDASREGLRVHRTGIIQAATGTGKGDLLAGIAAGSRSRVLVNVHRQDLVNDLAARIRLVGECGIVMGKQRDCDARIVVGCTPSLVNRLSDLGTFGLLITDEAHMATSPMHRKLHHLAPLHLGFTATPFRSAPNGGTVGLGSVFRAIFYRYSLQDAIRNGDLCRIDGLTVKTKTSLEAVPTKNGDFLSAELSNAVDVPARNNLVLDYFAGDTTLAFCAGIQHAIHLAERAKERGIAAEAVWGDDPERKEKLARFHTGETRLLTSADLLLVGYDEPRISTILMARPTQSRVLWTQAVGRGTRLWPGKECLRLFDFADIGMDLCGLEDLSEDDTLPVTRRLMPFAVGAEVEHKKDGRRGVVVQVELQHLVRWADGEAWHDRAELKASSDLMTVEPKVVGVRTYVMRLFDGKDGGAWYPLDGDFVQVRRKYKAARGPFGWTNTLVREVVYLRRAVELWAVEDEVATRVLAVDTSLTEYNWKKEAAMAPKSWKMAPGMSKGEAYLVRAGWMARRVIG